LHRSASRYIIFVDVYTWLFLLGKTHIARRIAKYLSFFHAMPVQLFNASEYRRKLCGSITDEEWFDVTNDEVRALRQSCNEAVIVDILAFLDKHVNGVVILDSTNPDHSRRINLRTKVRICCTLVMMLMMMYSLHKVVKVDDYARACINMMHR